MYLCVGNLAVDYTVNVTSLRNCLHHLLMCTHCLVPLPSMHCQVPVSLLVGWLNYMHQVPSKGTNTKFHCPVSINKSKSKSLWHGGSRIVGWMRSCASNEIVEHQNCFRRGNQWSMNRSLIVYIKELFIKYLTNKNLRPQCICVLLICGTLLSMKAPRLQSWNLPLNLVIDQ